MGHLITESFGYDDGRQVAVYVPADAPTAIVYAGDGQLIAPWGERLEASDAPPTMVVAAYRTDDPEERVRIEEYSPSFNPARFAAHEQFFVRDVRDWVRDRFGVALPPERTAVCGVSASGEFALAMGLRHPDVYGAVFCASPGGGFRPPDPQADPLAEGSPDPLPEHLPRTYLVAGWQEPWFLENARRWFEALQASGADVVMTERVGGHGDAFWHEEFPLMVEWAFGA